MLYSVGSKGYISGCKTAAVTTCSAKNISMFLIGRNRSRIASHSCSWQRVSFLKNVDVASFQERSYE